MAFPSWPGFLVKRCLNVILRLIFVSYGKVNLWKLQPKHFHSCPGFEMGSNCWERGKLLGVRSCQEGAAPALFSWEKKGLSTRAGKCRASWGEHIPVSTVSLDFGVKEEEGRVSMLLFPQTPSQVGRGRCQPCSLWASIFPLPCACQYPGLYLFHREILFPFAAGNRKRRGKKKREKEGGKFFHWEQISFSRVLTK